MGILVIYRSPMTEIRNRIKELRHVRAGDLAADPRNYRKHPKAQRDALASMLGSIGYADALIARETPDGSLVLIDGHLRANMDAAQTVPVLVTDLDEQEAGQLLATLDPLAGMAEIDNKMLDDLLKALDVDATIKAVLEEIHGEDDLFPSFAASISADILEEENSDNEWVPIRFDVPKQHRRIILRRIAPILAEYNVESP